MDNIVVNEDNSNNGLMTKIWGPGAWLMLEACAFGYPINPTEDDKKNFKVFYDSIKYVLPCKYCRISFTEFLQDPKTALTDDVLESRDTLTRWIFKIHNKVNDKLNVDYGLTYEDFVNKYENFRAKCVKSNTTGCNMPLKDKNKAYKMAYNKDFPLLECNVAYLFIPYAKMRGLKDEDFYFYNFYDGMCKKNVNYQNDPNCDIWFKRNDECYEITKKIRIGINNAIESEGIWKGLPTIYELGLIARLTTSLTFNELEEVIKKIKNFKGKKSRNYYLTK